MRFSSGMSPREGRPRDSRRGYVTDPYNARHSYEAGHLPAIHRKIDGPMLVCRNGEVMFLTLWERWLFWWGRTDALQLERKHRPLLELAELIR